VVPASGRHDDVDAPDPGLALAPEPGRYLLQRLIAPEVFDRLHGREMPHDRRVIVAFAHSIERLAKSARSVAGESTTAFLSVRLKSASNIAVELCTAPRPISNWLTDSEARRAACENLSMTKSELHELVERLPDSAVNGAALLLEEISAGRIDPDQAWFWTREWQDKEQDADTDLAAGRSTRFESDDDFLASLDERMKPLDADA
jgi:hypothetical protein